MFEAAGWWIYFWARHERIVSGSILLQNQKLRDYFEKPWQVATKNHWIGKATVELEVPMEAATLRELLHKLNAKVWLWFVPRRDGKKGWEIDRGRFKAKIKDRVYYDGPSTEGHSQYILGLDVAFSGEDVNTRSDATRKGKERSP